MAEMLDKVLETSTGKNTNGKPFLVHNQYTKKTETVRLSLYQRLVLGLFGIVKFEERHYSDWPVHEGKNTLMFYVFKHGNNALVLDYPHSYDGHFHTDLFDEPLGYTLNSHISRLHRNHRG